MFILLGHKGSVVGCDGGHGCSRRGGKGRWMRVVGVVHLLHDGPWEGAVGHPNLLAIYRVPSGEQGEGKIKAGDTLYCIWAKSNNCQVSVAY